MMKKELGCKERLIEKRDGEHTKKTERKIAAYLLENFDKSLHSTLLELADGIGVSDASIVRFCKSIGYTGFQEYKINAAMQCAPEPRLYNPSLSVDDSPAELCNKIFAIESSALEQTKQELDIKVMNEVADLLINAKRINLVGTGGSAISARDFQHKLLKIGVRAELQEDKDLQLMSASLLTENDVLFAISHSGSNLHVAETIDLAKKQNAKVVTLTMKSKNVVVEKADYPLYVVSEKTIFESESFSARLAQLAMLDCLVALMAFKNFDGSLEAMKATRLATSVNKE
ncbi:MAG: MurR/RpiR family transcriptional regulator [Blautia hansenii]|uniref:HTH-type transcriptional regulator RpiR n=1 Tax=Blautia hansenii TaxID=1322 RepID=A0A6N2UKH0_BLAHA